jgi:hypothetical protein
LRRRGAAVARDAVRRLVVALAMVASDPGLQSSALADRRGETTSLKRQASLVKPGLEA